MPLNRGNIQNLVIMIQSQLLRDVKQRFERIDVGGPAGNQILIVIVSKMYRCFHRCVDTSNHHIDTSTL